MIREEKYNVNCQGCYLWTYAQVLGHGILKKIVQGKDTLNKKRSLPCQRWCRGPLFFLHLFLLFILLLMLNDSGKLAIPNDHLFLLLHIMHIVLFKSMQRQGKLIISGRADIPLVWNGFVEIYFLQSVSKKSPPSAATMQQGLSRYRWQVETFPW